MPSDNFSAYADSPTAPAGNCFTIVPADGAEVAVVTKAVYVGSAGDIVLRAINGSSDVTFKNVPAGSILDVRVRFLRATGTTAADLVGLA